VTAGAISSCSSLSMLGVSSSGPLQHGFRSKISCKTQLIGFIQDLTSTMDSKMQTDMIVLDFAKAFDKVSH
jgi:hypothetical protein